MEFKAAILDMDGVLWKADQEIGSLKHVFSLLTIIFSKFVFCTNNSTKTSQYYQQKLADFGVDFPQERIITSSHATASLLSASFPFRGNLHVIGEEGVIKALQDTGFTISHMDPIAVVVGLDKNLSYQALCNATIAIRKGVPFFGTNPDKTFPTPRGLIPGAGAIIELIRAATGVSPIIAGKPQPFMIELALKIMGSTPAQTLVIGDRLDTDILSGHLTNCPTALVLSGVTAKDELRDSAVQPDFVAQDLTELLEKL